MRYTLLLIFLALFFVACKKDKFTTVPSISFKSFKPDFYSINSPPGGFPIMTIHVTDLEGDLGFISGSDTSFIYVTNLRTNKFDSLRLPNIASSAKKNFEGDIEVDMNLGGFLGVPNNTKKDTIFFNVYIKDFAKNKSNVIKTDKPIYYIP
jgi:hypothetical protein